MDDKEVDGKMEQLINIWEMGGQMDKGTDGEMDG